MLKALATAQRGSIPPTPSIHSLGRGLPGYLIRFAPHAFAHCPRFLAAASRRSRGRVSVPFWLVVLSDQLPVTGLVGRYLTNYLIGRRPLRWRLAAFLREFFTPGTYAVLALLSKGYPPPLDRLPTRYSAVCH